jgi:hypothetical protein
MLQKFYSSIDVSPWIHFPRGVDLLLHFEQSNTIFRKKRVDLNYFSAFSSSVLVRECVLKEEGGGLGGGGETEY